MCSETSSAPDDEARGVRGQEQTAAPADDEEGDARSRTGATVEVTSSGASAPEDELGWCLSVRYAASLGE